MLLHLLIDAATPLLLLGRSDFHQSNLLFPFSFFNLRSPISFCRKHCLRWNEKGEEMKKEGLKEVEVKVEGVSRDIILIFQLIFLKIISL